MKHSEDAIRFYYLFRCIREEIATDTGYGLSEAIMLTFDRWQSQSKEFMYRHINTHKPISQKEYNKLKGSTEQAMYELVPPVAVPIVNKTIIEFLLGEKSFNGLWFGEKDERESSFWWRKYLIKYILEKQSDVAVPIDDKIEYWKRLFNQQNNLAEKRRKQNIRMQITLNQLCQSKPIVEEYEVDIFSLVQSAWKQTDKQGNIVNEGKYPYYDLDKLIKAGKLCYEAGKKSQSKPIIEEDDSHLLFHECPLCNCRCNCTNTPCSCCVIAVIQ